MQQTKLHALAVAAAATFTALLLLLLLLQLVQRVQRTRRRAKRKAARKAAGTTAAAAAAAADSDDEEEEFGFGAASGTSLAGNLLSTLSSKSLRVQPAERQQQQQYSRLDGEFSSSSAAAAVAAEKFYEEDPLMSAEAVDEGENHSLGRINFSVGYNWENQKLTVRIVQAQNLPMMDFPLGKSDPYCKIFILPDKANQVKTQVKMRKLNPRWNEEFIFEKFPGSRLLDGSLLISVLDYDRFSRDDPIGDVRFPLVFLYDDHRQSKSLTVWRHLQPNRKSRGYVGSVLVALSYNPQTGHLTVMALKAKELKAMDIGSLSDPYCVAKLVHSRSGKLVAKRRSQLLRKTLCPQWNESFVFSLSPDKVHEHHVELVVKDKDFIGADVIGRIRLGTRSSPEETQHWTEMMGKPRQRIAKWHTLKH